MAKDKKIFITKDIEKTVKDTAKKPSPTQSGGEIIEPNKSSDNTNQPDKLPNPNYSNTTSPSRKIPQNPYNFQNNLDKYRQSSIKPSSRIKPTPTNLEESKYAEKVAQQRRKQRYQQWDKQKQAQTSSSKSPAKNNAGGGQKLWNIAAGATGGSMFGGGLGTLGIAFSIILSLSGLSGMSMMSGYFFSGGDSSTAKYTPSINQQLYPARDIADKNSKYGWEQDILSMEKELQNLANSQIKKVDTIRESIDVLEKNKQIVEKLKSLQGQTSNDSKTNPQESAQINRLYDLYNHQQVRFEVLLDANQIFECLQIKAETGGQNYDQTMDHKQFVAFHESVVGEGSKYNRNFVCRPGPNYQSQTKIPPPLEFLDKAERRILLPITPEEMKYNILHDDLVDDRIYSLLYYLYKVFEMEQNSNQSNLSNYQRYLADKVIQKQSTPPNIAKFCYKKLEDDPQICDLPQLPNHCGELQKIHYYDIEQDKLENLGVPFLDRSHLKIWIGNNSMVYSDEQPTQDLTKQEPLSTYSQHFDFKAIDITEIGLFNERTECTACRRLQQCPVPKSDIITEVEECKAKIPPNPILPCCPPTLYQASIDAMLPVEVCWQKDGNMQCQTGKKPSASSNGQATQSNNSSYSDTGNGNIASSSSQAATLSVNTQNTTSIQSVLGDSAKQPLAELLSIDFKHFNYSQSRYGNYLQLTSSAGRDWLQQKIFAPLGLPDNFTQNHAWSTQDQKSNLYKLSSGYINDLLLLPEDSYSPELSASLANQLTPSVFKNINLAGSTIKSPATSVLIKQNITFNDQKKLTAISLANLSTRYLNQNIFNWPDNTLDLNLNNQTIFEQLPERLTQYYFTNQLGLPNNYLFDSDNPKTTAMSLSAALIANTIENQNISLSVNQAITSQQKITLHDVLQSLTKQELNKILQFTGAQQKTLDLIYGQIQQPTLDQITFLQQIQSDIDYNALANNHRYLTADALRYLITEGTYALDPTGDLSLANISNIVISNHLAINDLSYEDLRKIAFVQEYLALNSNPNQEILNQLNYQYHSQFGQTNTPPLSDYSSILRDKINQNSSARNFQTSFSYLTSPLLVNFEQDLSTSSLPDYDYLDFITVTSADPAIPEHDLSGVMNYLHLNLNQLEIYPEDEYNNSIHLQNPQSISANQEYYLLPKFDVANLFLPGISNPQYNRTFGQFKLLESTTMLTEQSKQKPIKIKLFTQPESLQTSLSNYRQAFQDKFAYSYLAPDNTIQNSDTLYAWGGVNAIFNSLFTNTQQSTIQHLANLSTNYLAQFFADFNSIDENSTQDQIKTKISDYLELSKYLASLQTEPDIINYFNNHQSIQSTTKYFNSWTTDNKGKITTQQINIEELINQSKTKPLNTNLTTNHSFQSTYIDFAPQLGKISQENFLKLFFNPDRHTLLQIQSYLISLTQNNLKPDQILADLTVSYQNQPNLTLTPSVLQEKNLQKYLPPDAKIQSLILQYISAIPVGEQTTDIAYSNLITNQIIEHEFSSEKNQQIIQQSTQQSKTSLPTSPFNLLSNITQELDQTQNPENEHTSLINLLTQNNQTYLSQAGKAGIQSSSLSSLSNDQQSNLYSLLEGYQLPPNQVFNTIDQANNQLGQILSSSGSLDNRAQILKSSHQPALFKKCREKIARDNIIHLIDIALNFHRSVESNSSYLIKTDASGMAINQKQTEKIYNFYFIQIFSDFYELIQKKIAKKAIDKFDMIWFKDREEKTNVFLNDCNDRKHPLLKQCVESIHISF